MSLGLVEAHGGTLELTPQEPEAGAAFVIRLPVTGLRSTTGSPPTGRSLPAASPS